MNKQYILEISLSASLLCRGRDVGSRPFEIIASFIIDQVLCV